MIKSRLGIYLEFSDKKNNQAIIPKGSFAVPLLTLAVTSAVPITALSLLQPGRISPALLGLGPGRPDVWASGGPGRGVLGPAPELRALFPQIALCQDGCVQGGHGLRVVA